MLTCKEAAQLVSESLDRDLPPGRRFALRAHLLVCSLCRRYRRQLVFLRNLLGQYAVLLEQEEEEAPAARETGLRGLSPEARQRIEETLSRVNPPS